MASFRRQLDEEIEFLRSCNNGSEFMPVDHRARVMEIAYKYGWLNSKGERRPVLAHDEVLNLTIPSGTLTREERGIVNYHIVSTIKMLESLPYPKNLRNVPVHAGSHHERMDGKGYPLGLTRDQISMQGRIIAIADIFEALTATDRPYKRAKTLSEALTILRTMKEDGQIDPDLYELFMSQKLYLRYAEAFLDPEQVDVLESDEIAVPMDHEG
jgi:HD-GYP domain-containing protein (c-di-GMP phosphodiesterase class II)